MIRGWRYISTLLMAVVMLLSPLNVAGAGAALTPQGGTYVYDATSLPYDAPSDGAPRTLGELAGAWTNDDGTTGAVGLATGSNQISVWWPRSFVAPRTAADDFASWGDEISDGARMVDQGLGVPFRSNTSHIFRDAPGHLAQDTAANRALITSAVQPANLVETVTVGSSRIQTYQRLLPDGTQVWAQVRNGAEITNGGLNLVPR